MSQTRPIDEHSMHTRTCGELRFENVGEEVTLTGWVSRRRDHGGLIFCDLRDREGITQLTFDPEHSDGDAFKIAETMRPEWPIKIHGVVRARGEETTNTKLATGEIEVLTDHAEVLTRPSPRRSRSRTASRPARTPACAIAIWTSVVPR